MRKVVAFDGFKESAFPSIVSPESIIEVMDKQAPKDPELFNPASAEEALQLNIADSNSSLFSCHPYMVLPPFLWEPVLNLPSRHPATVFISFLNAMKDLGSKNEDSATLSTTALKKSCTRLFQFLWLAKEDNMEELRFSPTCDDQQVLDWSKFIHEQCLEKDVHHPPVSHHHPTVDPTTSYLETTRIIQNSIEQISKLAPEGSKKKSFDKLHVSMRNMILNASSEDGTSRPEKPCTHCLEFFLSQTNADAKMCISRALRKEFGCNVQISSGVVISLKEGNFLREYVKLPVNFSPFSFPKRSFKSLNTEKESLLLQLKELLGEGLSTADINGALNQEILVPYQVEFLRYNIKNTIGAAAFFFSENSILVRRLSQVNNHVKANLVIYESCQYNRKSFSTKILYALDTKIQMWLRQCESASYREDVDNSIIDFSGDLNNILMNQFSMDLPESIKEKFESNSKSSDEDLHSPRGKNNRKRKSSDSTSSPSPRLENNDMVDEWKISQEEYDRHFKHRQAELRQRPKLNGKTMCHRWHFKGYCFEDCNFKATHVPSSSICQEVKDKYTEWKSSMMNNN